MRSRQLKPTAPSPAQTNQKELRSVGRPAKRRASIALKCYRDKKKSLKLGFGKYGSMATSHPSLF
jgi:hypothetical protein